MPLVGTAPPALRGRRLTADLRPAALDDVERFIVSDRRRLLHELQFLVRIPSVSADPAHAGDVQHCAVALGDDLQRIGLVDVELMPTRTHPLVVGGWHGAEGRPTLLVYGHYDVQPAGPASAWGHPPFGATVVSDKLVGRGAADDKGQLFAHLAAIEALLRTRGSLPVNVVAVFDGAEELGEPSLATILSRQGPWQAADLAVVSDTRMVGRGRPALTIALRGLIGLDVQADRTGRPVHAGHLGGAIPDPLAALAEMLAGLHDRTGRISVPGFYERVAGPEIRIRPGPAPRPGPEGAAMLEAADAVEGLGEPGYDLVARTTTRPALTVTGLAGGAVGGDTQATIGTQARASLDIRIVPEQEPGDVAEAVARRLRRLAPPGIRVTVRVRSAVPPVRVDPAHPATAIAAAALIDGFGARPVAIRSGGSSPAVAALVQAGFPVVLMGFSLPDDRIHGPNERLDLPTFLRAIIASASLMERLGRAGVSW